MIEVTMPCTLRPELIEQTIDSFLKNVITKQNFQFVANIDFAPFNKDTALMEGIADKIINLIDNRYSITKARYRLGYRPNFAIACKWLWNTTNSDFVFHLEDDWIFLNKINLDAAIDFMHSHKVEQIRFPKVKAPIFDRVTCQPCLWRGNKLREIASVMVDNKDPEKQQRVDSVSKEMDNALPRRQELYDWPGGPYCDDNGRKWRDERKITKWNKNVEQEDITWVYPS